MIARTDHWDEDPLPVPDTGPAHAVVIDKRRYARPPRLPVVEPGPPTRPIHVRQGATLEMRRLREGRHES